MGLLEKLETRFDDQIVFPDELAREAATEIRRLRGYLEMIIKGRHALGADVLAKEALMQSPDVPQQKDRK